MSSLSSWRICQFSYTRMVGLVGFEPTRVLVLNQVDLPVVHRPIVRLMAESEGLEPPAGISGDSFRDCSACL
jgi:hypothetical protein